MPKQPLVLCILDGWGHREDSDHNAIAQAITPHWDQLLRCPHTLLDASGLNVGLPAGQMGNSEVGHMSIGAGRVIFQDLPRLDQAFADKSIHTNSHYKKFIADLKSSSGTCHLMGLLSPGGVHSHSNHIIECAKMLNAEAIPTVIHAFLDGRDTAPTSGLKYVQELCNELAPWTYVQLATIGGRFFAMDRDQRWDRVATAYDVIVQGQANKVDDLVRYIQACYDKGITDEFIPPVCLQTYNGMDDGDGLWMANFRADRVRQLLRALVMDDFKGFDRSRRIAFAAQMGMTNYADDLSTKLTTVFPAIDIANSLGEIIAHHGLQQFRIAETEKYAHVTFFFNGGREEPFTGEVRHIIPSPKVKTYDLKPDMAAHEVTEALIQAIESQDYDFIVVNYANADMVGHSGDLPASIKAVQVIDDCLGKIMQATDRVEGTLLITADHGNIEMLLEPHTHEVHTAHTLNPVPLVIYGNNHRTSKLDSAGTLVDIAPTILKMMGIKQPQEMTGRSLII